MRMRRKNLLNTNEIPLFLHDLSYHNIIFNFKFYKIIIVSEIYFFQVE